MTSEKFEIMVAQAQITLQVFSPGHYFSNVGCCDEASAFQMGAHAAYRRLNSNWGFKLFRTAGHRDANYDVHLLLEEDGVGPKMGPKFEADCHINKKVYGFICEHVPQSARQMLRAVDYDREIEKSVNNFRTNMYEKYEGIYDLHDNNIRVRNDGTFLITDVSFNGLDDNGRIIECSNRECFKSIISKYKATKIGL